jgi:uncharacterized protein (TIGR00251 family)
MNDTPWQHSGDNLTLYCHIQPGAKHNQIVGLHDRRIKIQLKAPPVDGKANQALCRYLAEICAIPVSRISIRQGLSNRKKTIEIKGISEVPDAIYELAP